MECGKICQSWINAAWCELTLHKQRSVRLAETTFREAMERRRIQLTNSMVAAFGVLGIVLWMPSGYGPNGRISVQQLTGGAFDQFMSGLVPC